MAKALKSDKKEPFKKEIIYNEDQHSYNVDGVNLIPVTTFISERFIRPFHPINSAIGKYRSNRDKGIPNMLPPERLVRYWNLNSKRANSYGTGLHCFAEMYDMDWINTVPIDAYEEAVVKFIEDTSNQYKLIGNEIKVYSKAHKLGGTIDRLLRNNITGKYVIMDWKTSSNIDKEHEGMLNEFKGWKECKRLQYEIQLLIYKELLQHSKLENVNRIKKEDIEDLWIVIIDRGTYKIEKIRQEVEIPVRECLDNICDYEMLIKQK